MTAFASSEVLELAQQCPPVRLPSNRHDQDLSQDEEWFEVQVGHSWRPLRLHDYDAIFSIPGLYEKVVYDLLKCRSPRVVRGMLADRLTECGAGRDDLHVLDLGAGNGCVAEELRQLPLGSIVGLDIEPEAREAAERDRPGLYDDYVVCDITDPTPEARRKLDRHDFTALTSVAALGFGDVPPAAFAHACDRVEDGGWIVFTIKEDFLAHQDGTGFAGLVQRMIDREVLEIGERRSYPHRLSTAGEPLTYVAFAGRKREDADPVCDLLRER